MTSIIPFLFDMALYVPAGAFFATGLWLLGPKDDTKELGIVTLFTALFQTFSILILFWVGDGLGAFTVVPLAFTWYILGLTSILGLAHFKPLANTLVMLVVTYVIEATYLLTLGEIMLPVMLYSYAIVVAMIIAWIYKGILTKATAYVLIFEAFLTVLLPALIMLMGIPFR